jgi:hypothetical protein
MSVDYRNRITFYPVAKAETMSAELNLNDEDWTYTTREHAHQPGKATIEIHDEDGIFVAHFNC